ncbi:MAG: FixH family protein [Azospirillaceae bacterium]
MPRTDPPLAAPAVLVLTLAAGVAAGPAAAHEIASEATCASTGKALVHDCTFTLTDAANGAPVEDAAFTVHPMMPSMPMAHNVRPVEAVPGDAPGTYEARIPLEMTGTWRLELRLTAPHEITLGNRLDFTE